MKITIETNIQKREVEADEGDVIMVDLEVLMGVVIGDMPIMISIGDVNAETLARERSRLALS